MDPVNADGQPRLAFALLTTLATLIGACAPPPPRFPELPRLGVSTYIGTKHLCGLGVSPAITVANTPPSATHYTLRITNTDVLYGPPWEETLPALPGGIPEGAVRTYEPPCLGPRQTYQYRIEVIAKDAANRSIAYGQTTVQVWPIEQTLSIERRAAGQAPARSFDILPTPNVPSEPPLTLSPRPVPGAMLPVPSY